jgi:dTDP-4-amino-4,6-dideoxygalactose transaminase
MLMHKLNVEYEYIPEKWSGYYHFYGTRVIDSARRLEKNMYSATTYQCLSFGHGKPLNIGHGGAILLDNPHAYKKLLAMRYDGRNLLTSPWQDQKTFTVGYHYRPTIEDAVKGLELLEAYKKVDDHKSIYVEYPDCREIKIED